MVTDTWSSGDLYEPYVGRWSRPVAARFVEWLAPTPMARWLDVGCGTGALTDAVLSTAEPAQILGVDPSIGFLDRAWARVHDDRAEFQVGEALSLPVGDGSADYVVSGLVLNFIPDPAAAVAEMCRAAADGATIAAYVWDYADGMQMIRQFWDAAVALDPAAARLDEAVRFSICRPEPLGRLFAAAGLADVAGRDIVVPTEFADFDDYWTPFLSGQAPAPGYCMSLDDADRERLRDRLRAALAPAGGPIQLTARAWAVKGTRRR